MQRACSSKALPAAAERATGPQRCRRRQCLAAPACKGAGGSESNGQDVYDLYDLGEFEQKGSRATKWGLKEDLVGLSRRADEVGVGLYFDAVLNHKAGADEKEKCWIQEVDRMVSASDLLGFHLSRKLITQIQTDELQMGRRI